MINKPYNFGSVKYAYAPTSGFSKLIKNFLYSFYLNEKHSISEGKVGMIYLQQTKTFCPKDFISQICRQNYEPK